MSLPPDFSYREHQSFFGPADVVIVGAGLVGLTAAYYLKQRRPTWRVVVLERGALPSGASTKNAGLPALAPYLSYWSRRSAATYKRW